MTVDEKIIHELHKAVHKLGGKSDLLGATGSYMDTRTKEETLKDLQEWNKANG